MPGLQIPRADIIDNGIAEDILRGIFHLYILRILSDDHPKLTLIVQRIHQASVRRNTCIRPLGIIHPLGKEDRIRAVSSKRLAGETVCLYCMSSIIDAETQHILLRTRDRRQNLTVWSCCLRIFRDLADTASADQIVHIRKLRKNIQILSVSTYRGPLRAVFLNRIVSHPLSLLRFNEKHSTDK